MLCVLSLHDRVPLTFPFLKLLAFGFSGRDFDFSLRQSLLVSLPNPRSSVRQPYNILYTHVPPGQVGEMHGHAIQAQTRLRVPSAIVNAMLGFTMNMRP